MKRKIKEIYIHIVIEEKRCFNASFNYPNDYPQAYYGMQYLSRCLTKHQSQTKDFVLCWWCVIRKLVKWWKAFEKWKILIHKTAIVFNIFFSKDKNMILSSPEPRGCSVYGIWHLLTQMKITDIEHLDIFNFQLCIPKKKNHKVFHKRTSKDFTFY